MASACRVRDQQASIMSVGYWFELQGHAPSKDKNGAIALRNKLFPNVEIYPARVDALG
jgi:hypothetical protein